MNDTQTAQTPPEARAVELLQLPVRDVIPTPDNPRTVRDDAAMAQLVTSVGRVGVMQPVVCRPHPEQPGKFDLRAGERRLVASTKAGLDTIPAVVREMTDEEAVELTVVENRDRQDLTPIEESRAVNLLLDRGWTVEDVAEKLHESPHWVAKRSRLVNLSPAWRRAVDDPTQVFCTWPGGNLAYVARFEHSIQDQVLQDLSEYWGVPTFERLKKLLGDLTRDLSESRWDPADADLLPQAGACSSCIKRAGAQPVLFEDMRAADGKDTCLDQDCWHAKRAAWLSAEVARLRAKHGDALVLATNYEDPYAELSGRTVSFYDLKKCRKSEKGALPCVWVCSDEVGRFFWAKPRREDAIKTGGPKPLKERRAALEGRRNALVVEAVREALHEAKRPTNAVLLKLVAAFGTDRQMCLGPRDATGWALFEQKRPSMDGLWKDGVIPVLSDRLNYYRATTCTLDEARKLAAFLDVDIKALQAEAKKALPDPKSWANLNEDGTPKKGGSK